MKCCGNGKAPGRTGIRAELFEASAEHIVEPIHELFQLGVVPSAWKEANILFKSRYALPAEFDGMLEELKCPVNASR